MDVLIDETSSARWETLTDAALAPIQQRWDYGMAVAAMGARVVRLEFRNSGETIALAQAVQRRLLFPLALITRGPVWVGNPSARQRHDALRALRTELGGLVLVTPRNLTGPEMADAGFRDVMTPSTVADISLTQGLRDRLHGKWRNRLVRAECAGINVWESRSVDDLRWILAADARQQRSRRYRALPAAFTESWHRKRRRSVKMLIAEMNGKYLASMLFLTHGTTATYHIGWTGGEGRKVSAHNLLLWRAAEQLASRGVQRLDLGVIDTENAPGLARFKLGAGSEPVPTGGTWLGW